MSALLCGRAECGGTVLPDNEYAIKCSLCGRSPGIGRRPTDKDREDSRHGAYPIRVVLPDGTVIKV